MKNPGTALDSAPDNGAPSTKSTTPDLGIAYYREIIEFTADAIISIDERGAIELFNKAAESLFGYPREEVIGQNIKMLMPAPHRENHDEYLESYRSTGKAKILGRWREVEGQRKDGSMVPIEIGVRQISIDGIRKFTGIVRDLTETKRFEQELRRSTQNILELSTPAIVAWDGVLVLPLIGTLDSARMQKCTETALTRMKKADALVMIIDITGVPVIDTMVANNLIGLASSVRLMGGQCILTGIAPATAITIVGLGIDLSEVSTRATLQEGLKLAIETVEGSGRNDNG